MEFKKLKAKIINSLAMGIFQQEISWRRGPSEEECLQLANQEVDELISLKLLEVGYSNETIIKPSEPISKKKNFWDNIGETFFIILGGALFIFIFSFVLVLVYYFCGKLFFHL